MKKIAFLISLAFASAANAGNTTVTLTADNEFWLYSGNAAGTNLVLRGEGHSWPTAFNFSFDVNAGDYLYVAARDQGGPQAWQAAISAPVGALYSNINSWKYIVSPNNNVSQAGVAANVAAGGWANPLAQTDYNASPWGARVNDPNAKWIWHDTLGLANGWNDPSSSDGTYAIFRTNDAVAAIPEPSTYAMMIGGLAMLAALRRRKTAA